jgi:hypothetical protein
MQLSIRPTTKLDRKSRRRQISNATTQLHDTYTLFTPTLVPPTFCLDLRLYS